MTYAILKSFHLIFVITWFAGLFYIVRLFIYDAEANLISDPVRKKILQDQYAIMKRRLWYGITWPSALITFCFGVALLYQYGSFPAWLILKLGILVLLYLYHFSCHHIYSRQNKGDYRYTSFQLRIWNEVATLFLFAIIFIVTLKSGLSFYIIILGLIILALLLFVAIAIYGKRKG